MVPAHVGEFDVVWERDDLAGDDGEACQVGGFFAGVVEGLEAEANS